MTSTAASSTLTSTSGTSPAAGVAAPDTPSPGTAARWLRRTPGDLLYLLTGLPVAIVSATVLWSLASAVTSVAGTVVLLPIALLLLLATLACARGFAHVERVRLAWTGEHIPAPARAGTPLTPPAPTRTGGWWRWWDWLRDGQLWLDLLHGSVAVALAVVSWSLTVAWLATGLAGVTGWLWIDRLDSAVGGGVSVSGLEQLPVVWQLAVGVVLLVTLVPLARGLSLAHAALARGTIGNSSVRGLAQRVEVLTASRAAAADAEAAALRSLERDLHDGPQQRLVRLEMDLASAQRRLGSGDVAEAGVLVGEARLQAQEALGELRSLSRGFAPPVLVDRGLVAAVESLAARSAVPAVVRSQLPGGRLPVAVERTAYFVVAESLTNAAKHSGARAAMVDLRLEAHPEGSWLVVRTEDDGTGGADLASTTGTGLRGLSARAQAVDGTLAVSSPAGGPTVVEARLPLR